MSSGEYRVYSYYDRIQAHFYNMNLFPYLVLTSESAVLLTSDVSSGLYFSDKEKKEMFLPGSTPAKAVSAPLCVKRVTSPISAISWGPSDGPTPFIAITTGYSGSVAAV